MTNNSINVLNTKAQTVIVLLSLLIFIGFTPCRLNAENKPDPSTSTPVIGNSRLRITVGNHILTATLYDNASTRDFISQLPLTVNMTDLGGEEKIFYPPKPVSTSQRNVVIDPTLGDINVYAPSGNMAIFYKRYFASPDLIRIARIAEGVEPFNVPGTVSNVTFELVQ